MNARARSAVARRCLSAGFAALAFASTAALSMTNPQVPPPTLPVVTIGTASLIAPSAAEQYYNGLSGRSGTSLGLPTAPEIVELARALKNNPDLIYEYVRNNIETVWMYGSHKGPLGTLIDKSGTAFDQAELMAALLTQAGYAANIEAGAISPSASDFAAWSNISDATSACQMLSSGGIPAQINGQALANCAYGNGTAISNITLSHAWVKVTIGGTAYMFDPSFKAHDWRPGMDLVGGSGFHTGTPLNTAVGGMNSGTDAAGAKYAAHLDAADLNSTLSGYAGTLISSMQTQGLVGAHMEDVVGGGVIVPYVSPAGGLRQTMLPYQVGQAAHDWAPGAMTAAYRNLLRVSGTMWNYPNSANDTMFDVTFYSDEIYGRALTVETDFDGHIGTQSDYWNNTINLELDGHQIVDSLGNPIVPTYVNPALNWTPRPTARGAPTTLSLTADHPYAAAAPGGNAGTYMDTSITKYVVLITSLTIVQSWGDVGPGLLARWSALHATNKSEPFLLHPPGGGIDGDLLPNFFPGSIGDLSREKAAAGWLAQYSKAAHLHAQLAKSVVQLHHTLGFIYGDNFLNPQYSDIYGNPDWVLGDNFDRLDVDSAFSLTPVTTTSTSAATRRGAVHAIAASASALEGSIGAQQADMPDTTSTASRFEWGNAPPLAEDPSPGNTPRKFYQFDSGNWSTGTGSEASATIVAENGIAANNGILSMQQQPALGAGTISQYENVLTNEITSYVNHGFEVVASQESFLGPGQRGGFLQYTTNQQGQPVGYNFMPSKQRGGAFVATKYDSNGDPTAIAHDVTALSLMVALDGSQVVTKGGGAGTQPDNMTNYSPSDPADVTKSRFVDKSHALGVSLQNGSLSAVTPASLSVGKGGAPYELSASLSYNAAPSMGEPGAPPVPTQPSGGWVNSWKNNLALSGSGLEAMGSSDPRAAAGTIVAFLAAQDIYANNAPSPQRDAAAALTQAWWAHQMSGNVASVSLGTSSRQFVKLATGDWLPTGGGSAKLTQTGGRVPYEYKCFFSPPPYAMSRGWDITGVSFDVADAGGNVQHFDNWTNTYTSQGKHACAQMRGFRLTAWTFANGVKDTLAYGDKTDDDSDSGILEHGSGIESLTSVSNSLGRTIVFDVPGHLFDNGLTGGDARFVTMTQTGGGQAPATASFTDPAGKVTKVSLNGWVTGSFSQNAVPFNTPYQIFYPDHPSVPAIQYDYDTLGRISAVHDAINLQVGDAAHGGRDPTKFFIADGVRGERDDPLGAAYTVTYDIWGHPSRFIDELGRETDQVADGQGRVLTTSYPEGDQEAFTYDGRGNVLTRTLVPKPGSAEAVAGKSLSTSVIYKEDATHFLCVTPATCNKPVSSTSANGWTTNYTWNTNGTLASVKLPTTGTAGRPEADYGYTAYAGASLLTSKVQYVARTPSVVKTETDYAYNSANYYVPSKVTVDPTGLNLITTLGYNAQGDVTSVKGPRTDIDTTSYFTYDLDRRNLLAIGPDPDGTTSGNQRVATKKIYDDAGHLIETDRGTANTISGSDFLANNWAKAAYDSDFNKILETTGPDDSSGNPLAATTAAQFSYDGANRMLCAAQRMNPVQYASLPSDACTVGPAGSYGPDRITKTVYDAAGQTRQEIRAFGTSIQEVYATHKFEPDGKEIAIADADAGIQIGVQYADALNATAAAPHQTNYAYDGFDRLVMTTYADNTTDQVTSYDSDGNPLTKVNRSGQSITSTYDKIDRMATKAVPAAGSVPANTVTWTYDLINKVTGLSDTNGNVLANTYDLGGRQLTASQTLPGMASAGAQTVTYTYDSGSGDKADRSKITWPDGYFVSYGYDAASRMTSATDSDGTALATRTYDNLGRPATIQYPNSSDNIGYTWTSEDDMLTLANNLAGGAANDVTYTNTFTPAHQINSATISNAAFKYTLSKTGADAYAAPNGLNQYTSVTPAGGSAPPANGQDCTGHAEAISYDCNGNLTGDGTLTLTYDPENRLMTASKTGMSASYLYDPLGRRTTKTVSGTVTNFLHDGDNEIAEYGASGNLQRRFVPGPAVDEPVTMLTCTGSGCAGATATKTMFHYDKLGSVVAMSKATDGQLTTNGGPYIYDAYGNCTSGGLPCSTGTPYLFTGQRFDPETGLYYFRARYYSSTTGRMLQTDAVGYAVDVNAYTYGNNDPTDQTDPSGMAPSNCSGKDTSECPSSTGTGGPAKSTADSRCLMQGTGCQIFQSRQAGEVVAPENQLNAQTSPAGSANATGNAHGPIPVGVCICGSTNNGNYTDYEYQIYDKDGKAITNNDWWVEEHMVPGNMGINSNNYYVPMTGGKAVDHVGWTNGLPSKGEDDHLTQTFSVKFHGTGPEIKLRSQFGHENKLTYTHNKNGVIQANVRNRVWVIKP